MLIYGENGNHQFGGATAAATAAYKTSHNRLQSATRVKALKRAGQQRQKVKRKVKAKEVKKPNHRIRRNERKSKNLSIKNVKFLKSLGFKVKKN